jgi:hypothetical protein
MKANFQTYLVIRSANHVQFASVSIKIIVFWYFFLLFLKIMHMFFLFSNLMLVFIFYTEPLIIWSRLFKLLCKFVAVDYLWIKIMDLEFLDYNFCCFEGF